MEQLDRKELGRRIATARDSAGLTQQQVAEALEIQRPAVVLIEQGKRKVSTLEITKLSRLFGITVSDLLQPSHDGPEQLATLLRAIPGMSDQPEFRRELDRIQALCREGMQLRKVLKVGQELSLPDYGVATPDSAGEAITQGESLAEQERQRLNLGFAPISDVSELIASQGVWATTSPLPDNFSGVFIHSRETGCVIVINRGEVSYRRNFSFAHEYAHALVDRSRAVITSERGDKNLIETRANAFAAAFLMPAGGVASVLKNLGKGEASRQTSQVYHAGLEHDGAGGEPFEVRTRTAPLTKAIAPSDVLSLAEYFDTSYVATVYRLFNLRYLRADERQRLLESEKDWSSRSRQYLALFSSLDENGKPEDEAQASKKEKDDLPHQILRLAIEAYRLEEISEGKLREISRLLERSTDSVVQFARKVKEDFDEARK